MADSHNLARYKELSERMLSTDVDNITPESEELMDDMDMFWYAMTPAEREEARAFGKKWLEEYGLG